MPTRSKRSSAAASASEKLAGKPAPAFELADGAGASTSLAKLAARRKLVLYFYPRDMTPGCTKEACAFRDRIAAIAATGAVVAGVSGDSVDSHRKFSKAHGLDFPLLSDPDHSVARRYGVYKKKSLYGREFMGIERTTFVIDAAGIVRKVFAKVKVEGHAEEVLGALRAL